MLNVKGFVRERSQVFLVKTEKKKTKTKTKKLNQTNQCKPKIPRVQQGIFTQLRMLLRYEINAFSSPELSDFF